MTKNYYQGYKLLQVSKKKIIQLEKEIMVISRNSHEETWIASKQRKFVIREMQIKPQWLYQFTPIRLAKLKFLIVLLPNCGAMEHTTGGKCKLLKPFGEKCDITKVEDVRAFYSSIPLLDICPKKACTRGHVWDYPLQHCENL